ncbi:MAG TPA: hypothetical protein VL651_15590 [Bacteroidia bacterium]|jgi:hypothetical protein|nr:hypothetical protein [Bacteroidia bacterium]
MKKVFYSLGIALLAGAVMITGCDSPSQNITDAKDALVVAQDNLKKAKDDSILAHQAAVAAYNKQIEANEQKLADYKVKIAKQNKTVRDEYEATIDKLEAKNAAMKTMVANNQVNATDSWEDFKMSFTRAGDEFNEDMTELGNKWEAFIHSK